MDKHAGILCINKTYGRTENGKRLLYKCIPDDSTLPPILVPYQIQMSFSKSHKNKYILFRCEKWNVECPRGEIADTIGDVDSAEAFNEYQVCRKRLNVSLTGFTNVVKQRLRLLPPPAEATTREDNEWNLISKIMASFPSIVDQRNYDVFTIDPSSCTDYDDAFSTQIMGNAVIVNVYISNVFLWMEIFQLWEHITDRVSTIYLPDKKRPMLPDLLSERLCSLQAGKNRVAFVMSVKYDIHSGKQLSAPTFLNALINVSKNYSYDDPQLERNKTYNRLRNITGHTDSHDVVAWWMIKMNEECARELAEKGSGIFRTQASTNVSTEPLSKEPMSKESTDSLSKSESIDSLPEAVQRWMKTDGESSAAKYSNISSTHAGLGLRHYSHITSPIRRISDIINQTLFMRDVLEKPISGGACAFIAKWMEKLEFMNESMRKIRRVQMDCELLELCNRDALKTNTTYIGMPIASERAGEYTIYIEKLKLITYMKTPASLPLFAKTRFQVFVFNDEARLCRKIRICLNNDDVI
jgi:exoribonuclease R